MSFVENQPTPAGKRTAPIAVVTGSSSGIGRQIALELARQGWQIVLHGRSISDRLLKVKDEIASLGANTFLEPFDFSSDQPLEDFVDRVFRQTEVVDAWINNAGGDVLTGRLASLSFEEKLRYLLKVDVTATLLLSRAVGARMKKQAAITSGGHGQGETQTRTSETTEHHASYSNGRYSIINIGWDQAAFGMAGDSGEMFATTKGAIMAMTGSLAQSLAPEVRVNCIAPGWIKTQWGVNASSYWDNRVRQESLMNRWGTPSDIAHLACFLCSPAASYISGQVIPVSGGFRYGRHTLEFEG